VLATGCGTTVFCCALTTAMTTAQTGRAESTANDRDRVETGFIEDSTGPARSCGRPYSRRPNRITAPRRPLRGVSGHPRIATPLSSCLHGRGSRWCGCRCGTRSGSHGCEAGHVDGEGRHGTTDARPRCLMRTRRECRSRSSPAPGCRSLFRTPTHPSWRGCGIPARRRHWSPTSARSSVPARAPPRQLGARMPLARARAPDPMAAAPTRAQLATRLARTARPLARVRVMGALRTTARRQSSAGQRRGSIRR
jgi:hypothetical protein